MVMCSPSSASQRSASARAASAASATAARPAAEQAAAANTPPLGAAPAAGEAQRAGWYSDARAPKPRSACAASGCGCHVSIAHCIAAAMAWRARLHVQEQAARHVLARGGGVEQDAAALGAAADARAAAARRCGLHAVAAEA